MARIMILVGHPRSGTFCEALGKSYAEGARELGHEVSLFLLSSMQFDPALREGFERAQTLEPDLQKAHDALLEADHLVVLFPLWMGMMPGLLHGFFERVMQPDICEPYRQKKFVKPLKGKSARVIMTMGMPGFVYRWWFGAYALKILKRNLLGGMGMGPIRSTIFGKVEGVGLGQRARWIAGVRQMGRKAR